MVTKLHGNKYKTVLSAATAVAIMLTIMLSPFEVSAAGALKAPAFPKVARASATSLKLTWEKVSGASGYQVFRYDSKAKKYKKVATISGANKTKWTNKKLATGKKYTYKIRSYRQSGFTKEVSRFTYTINAVPYKKNSKKVNAGSKLKGASTMTIGINQKLPVSVTVPPAKYGTAKGKKAIDSKIRLLPTSSSFVAQSGTDIIGKEVGTANVYAIAHNGNVKKVKVSVVDYAKPKSWMNLNRASAVANLIANQEANLTDIFAYFERHNDLSGHISLEDSGGIITENNINIIGIESQLLDLFGFSGMSSPSLYVCKDGVQLTFKTGYTVCWIALALQTDLSENIYNDLNGEGLKIAPHWCTGASYNPPI